MDLPRACAECWAATKVREVIPRGRALIVCSFLPYPQDEGDPLRVLMLVQEISRTFDVDLVAIARPDGTPDDIRALQEILPNVRLQVWNRERGGRAIRLLRALRRGVPVWVSDRYVTDAAIAVSDLAGSADIVLLIGEASGPYALHLSGDSEVIWDKANVLTYFTAQNLRFCRSARELFRTLLNLPLSYLMESRVIGKLSRVWVTSDEEASRLARVFRRPADAVIPSAVRMSASLADIDTSSRTVAWMSNMGYSPNWNGLVRFIRESRRSFESAGAKLRVIGSGLTPAKERVLRKNQFVEVVGFASDLNDAFAGVRCAIIPLWSGAGVKLKSITMMQMGVPVVATPVAMEGIPRECALIVSESSLTLAMTALGKMDAPTIELHRENVRHQIDIAFSEQSFRTHVERALAQPK